VREAIVIMREDRPGERRLVAYSVLDSASDASQDDFDPRTFLTQRLPDYMVPAAFITLAEMPLNTNRKIDRGALPKPTHELMGGGYVAPASSVERQIARIWTELLDLDRVGTRDNFFEVGGHSLLVVKLQDRLEGELGLRLSIAKLFEYPTIRALAEIVTQNQRRKVAPGHDHEIAGEGKRQGEVRRRQAIGQRARRRRARTK
jgi:acyl carrier protein